MMSKLLNSWLVGLLLAVGLGVFPVLVRITPGTYGALYEPGFQLTAYGTLPWVYGTGIVLGLILMLAIIVLTTWKKEFVAPVNAGLILGMLTSLPLRVQVEFYWLEIGIGIAVASMLVMMARFSWDPRAYIGVGTLLLTVGATSGAFIMMAVAVAVIIATLIAGVIWYVMSGWLSSRPKVSESP